MSIRCPHCSVWIHDDWETLQFAEYLCIGCDADGWEEVQWEICPNCQKIILVLVSKENNIKGLIYPRHRNRPPCPPEVPKEFAEDYNEACLILSDSPKAAAALGRRCLQHVLREKGGIPKQKNLENEITEVIKTGTLPPDIARQLDAIRNYGNFGAHLTKDSVTGEIIAIEPGEAEWTLEILEELFDWYFVRPIRMQEREERLNAKLKSAGKPPMKGNSP